MIATTGFGKPWMRASSSYSSCRTCGRFPVAGLHRGVQGDDVAAHAEAALARTIEQHVADCRIALEAVQRAGDQSRHLERERVDRGRPVERDVAERALALGEHGRVAGGGAHRAGPTTPRAMISRMISLVPSRIWWTRRSRTSFSMP